MGTPQLESKGHLSGLNSSLQQDFEEITHQPEVEVEDGSAHLVKLHVLAFVPCMTTEIALEQGPQARITKAISCAFTRLGLQDRAFDPTLDWMQASFMAQADGTYTGHIYMRHDPLEVEFTTGSCWGNELLAHLRSAFPGHFLLDHGASAEQKKDRVERRAGAEASASAGGTGLHKGTGAGAEGSLHGASAGAGPLPARQTTIAWPVVGGEGVGDLRITGCRSRTGQSDLGLPAQTSGAATTAPGMIRTPG